MSDEEFLKAAAESYVTNPVVAYPWLKAELEMDKTLPELGDHYGAYC